MSENVKHTPGPWRFEQGGGHAHNRIVGAESVQVSGWPEPVGGIVNASYSASVCENLGDTDLPAPAANARLIAAAPDLLAALMALDENGHTDATWMRAKRAIAKATGDTP